MNFVAAAVASLALILGTPAPVATEPATVELAAPIADQYMQADAWETYDAMHLEPSTGESVPLILEYLRTEDYRPVVATVRGEFVIESLAYPGKFHVMRYTRIWAA